MSELLKAVLEKVASGIIVVDGSQKIVIWNSWLERLTNKSQKQVIGQPLATACPGLGQNQYITIIDQALHAGQSRFCSGLLHKNFVESSANNIAQKQNMQVEPLQSETTAYAIIQIMDITGQYNRVIHLKNVIQGLELDYEEIRAAENAVKHQALHDHLTGLPNRALCNDRLKQYLNQAERRTHMLAVMFLDLDGFKYINDTYGHDTGDKILIAIANRLKKCVRKADTLARLGGDEFIIILPQIKTTLDIITVANKIVNDFMSPFKVMTTGHPQIMLTASIGVSVFPKDGATANQLIKQADAAMYRVKASGKNGFRFS